MRYLCDVHISYKVCKFLEQYGHQAIHVNSILNKWFTEDSAICEYADQNDYIVN
jgi:predicted nuclease of predicted toxin-antitoxin system